VCVGRIKQDRLQSTEFIQGAINPANAAGAYKRLTINFWYCTGRL